ncbi:MAG: hypothetical protein ABEI76_00500 [Halobacteriales archaeon]
MSGTDDGNVPARLVLLPERSSGDSTLPTQYLKTHRVTGRPNIIIQYRTASGINTTAWKEQFEPDTLIVIVVGDQLAGVQGRVADRWQGTATEIEQIQSGSDLTGLAMNCTRHLDALVAKQGPPVVWFDSLGRTLDHVDIDSVVRFLQVCLGKLEETGATAHFLCQPETVDKTTMTTLRQVFSTVVRIEGDADWTIEE